MQLLFAKVRDTFLKQKRLNKETVTRIHTIYFDVFKNVANEPSRLNSLFKVLMKKTVHKYSENNKLIKKVDDYLNFDNDVNFEGLRNALGLEDILDLLEYYKADFICFMRLCEYLNGERNTQNLTLINGTLQFIPENANE